MGMNLVLSSITMIVVLIAINVGVGSLTGNHTAAYAFGAAAGWFAYNVIFILAEIKGILEDILNKKS